MANEIKASMSLNINDGSNYRVSIQPNAVLADMSSSVAAGGVQTVGTAAELLAVGDVSTAGWTFFQNLSTTSGAYVDIGGGSTSSFTPVIRLYPGEPGLCGMASTTIVVRASTSQTNSVALHYHLQSR